MADPKHCEILKQGVDAWNRWRSENREIIPDLSGANLRRSDFGGEGKQAIDFSACELRGAQFERSILWGANFEKANLDAANLRLANLSKANFRDASLQAADLRGADLIDAEFSTANLYKAVLEDADLERSNLANARSLSAEQLAGTRLFQTTLPASIASFPALRIVDELSKNARTLVISMLGACAYCWLTVLQTADRSLIAPLGSASAKLPIIGVDLPIVVFFAIAPYILIGLYLYVHFTLSRLWVTLSLLPAIFPGGEPLTSIVYTWLPPDVICKFIPRLSSQKQVFQRMQRCVTVLLVWLSVPITIALFWARYLTAHEWPITIAHIFLTAGSATAASIFYRSIGPTLSPPRGRRELLRSTKIRRAALGTLMPSCGVLLTGLFLSYGALYVPEPDARQDENVARAPYAQFLRTIATNGLFRADINSHDFDGPDTRPIRLSGRNLTYVSASKVDWSQADLKNADLRYGELDDAKFTGADLSGADLSGARSENAFFQTSFLTGARLCWAELRQSNFDGALAHKAIFRKAALENTSFQKAYLRDADFTGATLSRADLSGADLTGVNFEGALMDGVKLSGAVLDGADLWGADLTGAAGLDAGEVKKKAKHWEMAFYDVDVAAALGLPPNHNKSDTMLRLRAQYHDGQQQSEAQSRMLNDRSMRSTKQKDRR